jgi:hypothetical protein
MREITLDSVTEEQIQSEAQILVNMIRTKYPKLDLRRGTVLRDLLIDADSAVGCMFNMQADEQRNSSSLLELLRRSEAGEEVDADDVNAVMSNFNMESVTGTRAKGYVRVFVSSDSGTVVGKGVQFHTANDIYFTVTTSVVASMNPSSDEVQKYQGVSNFWFLVPVEAVLDGSNGNLEQGTALEPDSAISDFVSASAYKTFSGGSDLESLNSTVSRIKESLSVRSLTTETAMESQLRDRFDNTEHPIVAVSLCGYGNEAQHRDKHNLFGVGVGGRVDAYVRNFTDLPVSQAITKPGVLNDDGSYSISISHSEVPGIISVYSVTDPDSDALSSYSYKTEYSGDVSGVWHDFDVSKNFSEIANTVWRDLTIRVEGVPPLEGSNDEEDREFRVEVIALPFANELQDFVDDGLVMNVGSDFVVRGPMVVNLSVNAVVRHSFSVAFDVDKAVTAICSYVNTSGFVGRITRSEIASILRGLGATSVDLFDENAMLYGYAYDAFGRKHEMSGDAIDLDLMKDVPGMLTKDTAVFVLEPRNVQIKKIAVS